MRSFFPQSTFARLARLGVAVALCLCLGAHWAALQGVAWTGMLITYTHESSFVEAVGKTFSGENPCALCQAVKKGHSEEQKNETKVSLTKMEAVLESGFLDDPRSWKRVRFVVASVFAPTRSSEPTGPPPRS